MTARLYAPSVGEPSILGEGNGCRGLETGGFFYYLVSFDFFEDGLIDS